MKFYIKQLLGLFIASSITLFVFQNCTKVDFTTLASLESDDFGQPASLTCPADFNQICYLPPSGVGQQTVTCSKDANGQPTSAEGVCQLNGCQAGFVLNDSGTDCILSTGCTIGNTVPCFVDNGVGTRACLPSGSYSLACDYNCIPGYTLDESTQVCGQNAMAIRVFENAVPASSSSVVYKTTNSYSIELDEYPTGISDLANASWRNVNPTSLCDTSLFAAVDNRLRPATLDFIPSSGLNLQAGVRQTLSPSSELLFKLAGCNVKGCLTSKAGFNPTVSACMGFDFTQLCKLQFADTSEKVIRNRGETVVAYNKTNAISATGAGSCIPKTLTCGTDGLFAESATFKYQNCEPIGAPPPFCPANVPTQDGCTQPLNGSSSKTCNSAGTAYGACVITCNPGAVRSGSSCIVPPTSFCQPNFVNLTSCPKPPNGSATQICNSAGTAYGECTITCDTGFRLSGTSCVPNPPPVFSGTWVFVESSGDDGEGGICAAPRCSNLTGRVCNNEGLTKTCVADNLYSSIHSNNGCCNNSSTCQTLQREHVCK